MAPEFFPFLAFAGLAVIFLIALAAGAVLLVLARRDRHLVLTARLEEQGSAKVPCKLELPLSRVLRILAALAFAGAFVVALALFVLGAEIRQQYFLNEPFVSACEQGNLAEARRLLSRGAKPDSYGIDYVDTGLTAASKQGHFEIVEFLLRHGANPELPDIYGKTALQSAKEVGHNKIAAAIEQAGRSRRLSHPDAADR